MLSILDQERKLFGYVTNYEKFFKMKQYLEPHAELWKSIGKFLDNKKSWMSSTVFNVDPSEIESIIKHSQRDVLKILKRFNSGSLTMRVIEEYKDDIQYMQKHYASIEVISNPGLKQRHWDEIQELMGIKFNYLEGTLKEIINKGFENYIEKYICSLK